MRRALLALALLPACSTHTRYPYEKTLGLEVSGGLPQQVQVTFGATPSPIAQAPAERTEAPAGWRTEREPVPEVRVGEPSYLPPTEEALPAVLRHRDPVAEP